MAENVSINDVGKQLKKLNVHSSSVAFPPKAAPGTRCQKKQDLVANAWGLVPAKNIPIYRYDFRVHEEYPPKKDSSEARMKEVTKQTRDDYILIERINKCVAVFTQLVKDEPAFFGSQYSLVYDRAATLYSLKKLPIGQKASGDATVAQFILPKDGLPKSLFNDDCLRVIVLVKACTEDFQLTTNDLAKSIQMGVSQSTDHSFQQFLEVLIAQEIYFSNGRFISYSDGDCYLMNPEELGFSHQDMPELNEGKYVGIGASKSVHAIEGMQGKGGLSAAVIIDVKKTAFHMDNQKLLDKIMQLGVHNLQSLSNRNVMNSMVKVLRGLHVMCTYGKSRSFRLAGFTQENADTMKFKLATGEMQSVAKYYASVYKIKLAHPQLPLVIEKKQPRHNYYPIELLKVCENQRVKQSHQTPSQLQKMIRACAIPPSLRLKQTIALAQAMKVDTGNQAGHRWLKNCDIDVKPSLTMVGRVLPAPAIEYNNGGSVPVNGASWSSGLRAFLIPAKCDSWYLIALLGARERRFDDRTLRAYVECFLKMCRTRGMQIKEPLVSKCIPNAQLRNVDECFAAAAKDRVAFIHFVVSDDLTFHVHMKKLEAERQILTQDLKASTAAVAPSKALTLENIVSKTNLKLGGLNFVVRLESSCNGWLANSDRLIVGIDIAHPPLGAGRGTNRVMPPSVLGYSANCKAHYADFIGGYRFCKANMEELIDDTLAEVMKTIIQSFHQNRGKPPTHLLIIRDGISEGQYRYVIDTEVELIKAACKQINESFRPHITVIIISKTHNLRLYKSKIERQAKAAEQNVPPGTVVDQCVVSPVLDEFFLNSHSSFQGTAKPPRYTRLFDTSQISADELQGIMHGLAYNFQIVNSAVSRPSPVMIAKRMAQRGRSNLSGEIGDDQSVCSDDKSVEEEIDVKKLNQKFGYEKRALSAQRFNA